MNPSFMPTSVYRKIVNDKVEEKEKQAKDSKSGMFYSLYVAFTDD